MNEMLAFLSECASLLADSEARFEAVMRKTKCTSNAETFLAFKLSTGVMPNIAAALKNASVETMQKMAASGEVVLYNSSLTFLDGTYIADFFLAFYRTPREASSVLGALFPRVGI